MAPRKGFSPFTRVISDELISFQRNWYVLTTSVCGGTGPCQYFRKSSVVQSFPDEFKLVNRATLRLVEEEAMFDGKAVSEVEVVASSFGLLAVLFRQQAQKSSFQKDPSFGLLKGFLNGLDFSVLSAVEHHEAITRGTPFPATMPSRKDQPRPRVARKLTLPAPSPVKGEAIENRLAMTPKQSGGKVEQNSSPNMKEICENSEIDTPEKKLLITKRGQQLINQVNAVCEEKRESLSTVLSFLCAFGDQDATGVINDVIEDVASRKGVKRAMQDLAGEDTYAKYVDSLRVPDWVLLFFKTRARISGHTWQAVINITQLGRTRKSSDIPVLLNTNEIKAVKRMVFGVCKELMGIQKVSLPIQGYCVQLAPVVEMIAREQRLHQISSPVIKLMIKIDGRPFWGRDQVLIGVVPRVCPLSSNQSAKSVFPLVIGNCKENRENLKIMLEDVNHQKKILKENGIDVDGKHYQVQFIVIVDYKTLILLLVKKDDEDFLLGGRGVSVEFCFICNAIRGCTCHDVAADESCMDCLRSKANIGRSSGIRDDLLCLLDEELSSIQLCALHMEMRNTEQLLASVGLMAYKVDSLKEANAALKGYGPESFHGDRITLKKKAGQESAVSKHNIHVSSMSGPTELEILQNIEDIVHHALPVQKMKDAFTDLNTAKNLILNRVTFCQSRIDYFADAINGGVFARDFGTSTEEINLDGTAVKQDMELRQQAWEQELEEFTELFKRLCKCRKKKLEKENEHLAVDVATKQVEMLKRVCKEWKEIAFVTRNKVFKDTEQADIDLFDVKCKEWGFLLKELFGSSLGTGDYGHLTIDHAPMLLRRFLSMREYSQQGFEASHKDQRQLWLKVSSHDQHGEASSSEQILVHFYAERMLFMRYCFREALKTIKGRTHEQQTLFRFHFRGCGWRAKDVSWDNNEVIWIKVMDQLMTMMFGADFLAYAYDKKKNCYVHDDHCPTFVYHREDWVSNYIEMISALSANETEKEHVEMPLPSSTSQPAAEKIIENKTVNGSFTEKSKENQILISDDENSCGRSDYSDMSVEDATIPKPDRALAVYPPPPAMAKVTILQMDLETVYDGNELNDAIVDFFMLYTADTMNHEVLQNSHIMSSYFFSSLSQKRKKNGSFVIPSADERYARASSFTNRVDLFEKDYIFIPVCRSGHWFLAVVYNLPGMTTSKDYHKQAPIFMVDSIVWDSGFSGIPSSREQEANLIQRCEWQARKGTGTSLKFDETSMPVMYPKVPQQENGYDCGVFVLLFFQNFLERKFPIEDLMSGQILRWYSQESAQDLRQQIEYILLQLGS